MIRCSFIKNGSKARLDLLVSKESRNIIPHNIFPYSLLTTSKYMTGFVKSCLLQGLLDFRWKNCYDAQVQAVISNGCEINLGCDHKP